MPRSRRNQFLDSRFWQHDDRVSKDDKRRVSLKTGPTAPRKIYQARNHWLNYKKPWSYRRPGSSSVHCNDSKRGPPSHLQTSPSSWYKVTLCSGWKYDRKEMFKILQSRVRPQTLLPIGVRVEDIDLTFYVDNWKMANTLLSLNLKVALKDGWKLQISVSTIMPFIEVNDELKDNMKIAMSARFNSVDNSLDLSRFHADDSFLKSDTFVPLNSKNVLQAAFQIIIENIPNIRQLNLSGNMIFTTEHFSIFKAPTIELKILDMRNNKIRDIKNIKDNLSGIKLEEIWFDNNPLCEHFTDGATYIRELRKIFPTLQKLDGMQLPPIVSFDIDEELEALPAAKGFYLCCGDAKDVVKQFVEQYYIMYDNQTSKRQLLEAYHDDAVFSMSAYTSYASSGGATSNLDRYITESRNLLKVASSSRRTNMLKHGKAEIVSYLQSLPETEHDPSSFVVDVIEFTPQSIHIHLNGIFRETRSKLESKRLFLRSFNRVFVLTSSGSGFKISNDSLMITDATDRQIKTAFENEIIIADSNRTPLSPTVDLSDVNLVTDDVSKKFEMVQNLASQTGMNVMWSEKCLSETHWDYNKALNTFTEFHKQGVIPAEAFISS